MPREVALRTSPRNFLFHNMYTLKKILGYHCEYIASSTRTPATRRTSNAERGKDLAIIGRKCSFTIWRLSPAPRSPISSFTGLIVLPDLHRAELRVLDGGSRAPSSTRSSARVLDVLVCSCATLVLVCSCARRRFSCARVLDADVRCPCARVPDSCAHFVFVRSKAKRGLRSQASVGCMTPA